MKRLLPRHNKKGGYVLLLAAVLVMFGSSILLSGVADNSLIGRRNTTDFLKSRNAYFVSEAALEDAVFRLKKGYLISSGDEIEIDGHTAFIDVSDTLHGKNILATGNVDGDIRKISAGMRQGVGADFSYGVQTGTGGFVMDGGATVEGNVYSNGDIVGGTVTGTAIAANSISETISVLNDSPDEPASSIVFGKTTATEDVAQSFIPATTELLGKIQIKIKKISTPGNITVRIVNDSSNKPGNTTITQGTLFSANVTNNFGWVDVVFNSNPELQSGVKYWLVLDNSSTGSTKYYEWAANNTFDNNISVIGRFGNSWGSSTGYDGYFRVFVGGITSEINGTNVGTSGSGYAHAHSVVNSEVTGSLYCKTGSGNNKLCNTSKDDPLPQPFPISDANIDQWKADAATGGTIGSQNISEKTTSIGPKKIDGDLIIDTNGVVTLTGVVWVTGDIHVQNNGVVKLSSSYGSNSGVLLADGIIVLGNNVEFFGSGQQGSYVMLLTTNTSDAALTVNNNAGTVLLNAQKGGLDFANNSGAKEATAKKIHMNNNATIIYESGITNINFSSGPSGGWEIEGWGETQ